LGTPFKGDKAPTIFHEPFTALREVIIRHNVSLPNKSCGQANDITYPQEVKDIVSA
jgi:hypothetical protein